MVPALAAAALLALTSSAAGIQVEEAEADSEIKPFNLTVCNAYPDAQPLGVFALGTEKKLTEKPLAYRACAELSLELEEGERLDFRLAGTNSVGVFRVKGLPPADSSLLLIPYRRGYDEFVAGFHSHVFLGGSSEAQAGGQVAVIDAYRGGLEGEVLIKAAGRKHHNERAEAMKPGSVVGLAAGAYEVTLAGATGGKSPHSTKLRVQDGSRHLVMRVGVGAEEGEHSDFAPELLVFSSSIKAALPAADPSGSCRANLAALAAAAAAMAAALAA